MKFNNPSQQNGISKEQEHLFYLDQLLEKAIIRATDNRMLPLDYPVLSIWGSIPSQFVFRPLTLNTKLGHITQLAPRISLGNTFSYLASLSSEELSKDILGPATEIIEAITFLYTCNKKLKELDSVLYISSLDYWNSIISITKYFISKKSSSLEHAVIHPNVLGEIRELFKSQITPSSSIKEQNAVLFSLYRDVKSRLYLFDPTFWDAVLLEIDVYRSKNIIDAQYKYFIKSRPSPTEEAHDHAITTNILPKFLEDDHPQAIALQLQYANSKQDQDEEPFGAAPILSFDNQGDPSRRYIPRYYSRVFAGYDWNRYNQTHYDVNNPPPKYVQGYKFVVFYPRLSADSTQVANYELTDATGYEILSDMEPHQFPSTKPTEIISFIAPPPYVTISFKIIKDIWECNHKRGFKCYYENGLLYLEFHFKKTTFRR